MLSTLPPAHVDNLGETLTFGLEFQIKFSGTEKNPFDKLKENTHFEVVV